MSESNVEQLANAIIPPGADLIPMPMPGGRDQFWNLLAFLSDKKSFETRLKAIEKATQKHNETIQGLGGLKDLDKRLADVSAREAALENVNQHADNLVNNAQAQADRIISEARKTVESHNAQIGAANASLKERIAQVEAQEQALNDRENSLATAEAELEKAEQNLERMQKGAEEAKSKAEEKHQVYDKLLKSLTEDGEQPSNE